MRADLAADLHRLAGLPAETAENLVFCVSEMFSNAVGACCSSAIFQTGLPL
ncbi:ATP-binding protein [Nocardiopsis metallicus]|uniref:Uncharacterized protein n=1 Tax=Nocardiopsis metallicus TaxID=179819 RepID=A0A840WNM0_9ACTN|nr:ATP-binding protein [Nocardiopsis metallicus]MBB5493375.1 hypothetical protein [Nocardiopsis metallicus]